MSTSGRILADFHPIRTYFGFFNPLRLFIFENGAASTFIRPSTFIPEVRVGEGPWFHKNIELTITNCSEV